MTVKKTLRLGFIMGGGVSLGTFSGAALSETIKQQLVYGQYDTGEVDEAGNTIFAPYDKIEIDVFSGASAGAISLAIMLRILSNPRDKFHFLGFRSYEQMREVLDFRLSKQFGEQLEQLKSQQPHKYEQLLAAQTLQEFQEKAWAKKINLEKLLGAGAHYKDLRHTASFLDRSVVDELAKELFKFEVPLEERLAHRTLLGKRVLFGCTLANLSHTLKKSRLSDHVPQQEQALLSALNDSSIARVHSELRVFDINFDAIIEQQSCHFPLRWVQYHEAEPLDITQQDAQGEAYPKTIQALYNNEVWKEIAATAIASAAVPLAFEPVVLNRYRYEFGQQWAEALDEKDSYPFTYVDGGLFNNEPIQEALRLAATLDKGNTQENFDRQLIFVDPNVANLEQHFRIQAHEKVQVGRSLFSNKIKTSHKSSAARIGGSITHLLSALLNEAQSTEMGRLSTVLQQLEQREQIRAFYRQTLNGIPTNTTLVEMRQFAQQALDKLRAQWQLSTLELQLQQELLRVIKEETTFLSGKLPLNDERGLVDAVNAFCYLPEPAQTPYADAFVFVLSCLNLDIALQLIGKTPHPTIVPIAPFDFYNYHPQKALELMALPGSGMAGFTGFASDEASKYEVAYGKYCAARILQLLQLTNNSSVLPLLPPPFDKTLLGSSVSLQQQVQASIIKRLKELVPSSFASVLPFLNNYLNKSVEEFVSKNIQHKGHCSTFEFRIRIPNALYVLKGFDAHGAADKNRSVSSLSIDGAHYLVAKIDYDFSEEQWIGAQTNFMQQLYVERSKLLDDVPVLQLELPALSLQRKKYLSPQAVFETDIRQVLQQKRLQDLPSNCWEFLSNVSPLNQDLW